MPRPLTSSRPICWVVVAEGCGLRAVETVGNQEKPGGDPFYFQTFPSSIVSCWLQCSSDPPQRSLWEVVLCQKFSSGIFQDECSNTQWPGTLQKLDLSSAGRQPLFHAMLRSVVCQLLPHPASQPASPSSVVSNSQWQKKRQRHNAV